MKTKQNYPKFDNIQQEGEYLTKELGLSNVTAKRIINFKRLVLKRMAEVK